MSENIMYRILFLLPTAYNQMCINRQVIREVSWWYMLMSVDKETNIFCTLQEQSTIYFQISILGIEASNLYVYNFTG